MVFLLPPSRNSQSCSTPLCIKLLPMAAPAASKALLKQGVMLTLKIRTAAPRCITLLQVGVKSLWMFAAVIMSMMMSSWCCCISLLFAAAGSNLNQICLSKHHLVAYLRTLLFNTQPQATTAVLPLHCCAWALPSISKIRTAARHFLLL